MRTFINRTTKMKPHIVFILFAVTFICAQDSRPNIKPTIQLLRPRGFRVSIPHEDGIELFVFRGTVNRPTSKESGRFFEQVTQPRDHRWTFEDRHTQLKAGDVISFKMKIVKNLLGYTWVGEFEIPGTFITTTEQLPILPSISPIDTVPTPSRENPMKPYTPLPTTESPTKVNNNKKPTFTETPTNEFQSSLDLANSIYNTVENLTVEIKRLREINAILVELVEQNSTMSRTLTLSGMLPPYDDEIYIVQVVLKEKLGLHLPIMSARKNGDGSITFEMASVNDKIHVIKSAKLNLRDSKIQLIY